MSEYHFCDYGVMIPMVDSHVSLPAIREAIDYWKNRRERELANPVYRFRAARGTESRIEFARVLRRMHAADPIGTRLFYKRFKAALDLTAQQIWGSGTGGVPLVEWAEPQDPTTWSPK